MIKFISFKLIILYLLIVAFTRAGWSQIPNIIVDQDSKAIEICESDYTLTITVENTLPVEMTNVQLIYQLDDQLSYVPNSVEGGGVIESSITTDPTFSLPNIPISGRIEFRVNIATECFTRTNLSNAAILSYNGQNDNYPNLLPNELRLPTLIVTPIGSSTIQAGINDVVERSFEIKNSGLVDIKELVFIDEHDDGIEILEIRVGNETLPSSSIRRDGSGKTVVDIPNNIMLPEGESIIITEKIQVKKCRLTSSIITAGATCRRVVCIESNKVNATIIPTTSDPRVRWELMDDYTYPTLCKTGKLRVKITNRDAQQNIYNLTANLGIGEGSSPTINNCYTLDGFNVFSNALQPDASISSNYSVSFDQFNTDPDGIDGLADLNGDGIFNDLAPGEDVILEMSININDDCRERCNLGSSEAGFQFLMHLYYETECGNEQQQRTGSTNNFLLGASELDVDDDLADEYAADELNFAAISFSGVFHDQADACPNALFEYYVTLPQNVRYANGQNPIFNGTAIDYRLRGDTLIVQSDSPTGSLTIPFIGICPELLFISEDCVLPTINSFRYSVRYYCETSACNQFSRLYCGSTPPFLIRCQGDAADTLLADVKLNSFNVERTTLGWTDSTQTIQVNPEAQNLRLNTAMAKDEVLLRATGTFQNIIDFDSLFFRVYYFNNSSSPYLDYIADTIRFFDAETAQTITCINVMEAIYIDEFHQIRVDLSELSSNTGCLSGITFTPNDRIEISIKIRVSERVPLRTRRIAGLRANFYSPSKQSNLICSQRSTVFRVLNPRYSSEIIDTVTSAGCNTTQFILLLTQGNEEASPIDPFPNEFRPYLSVDQAVFELPQTLAYIPNTALLLRDKAKNGRNYIDTVLLNTPTVSSNGDRYILTFDLPTDQIDYIGEFTNTRITVQAVPQCLSSDFLEWRAGITGIQFAQTDDSSEQEKLSIDLEDRLDFRVGRYELESIPETYFGERDTAEWIIDLSNAFFNSTDRYDLPNNWMAFEFPENVQVVGLIDDNTGENLPLAAYDSLSFWAQLGDIEAGTRKRVQLSAIVNSCDTSSILVRANFGCQGYPDNPATFEYPDNQCEDTEIQRRLFIQPNDAFVQASMSPVLDELPTFCSNIPYEIRVLNTLRSKASNISVTVTLPQGQGIDFVPNTSQLIIGDQTIALSDPRFNTVDGNYEWILSDIGKELSELFGTTSGLNNSLNIQFELTTNCNYLDRSVLAYQIHWTEVCGKSNSSPEYFTRPIRLREAPTEFNQYDLSIAETTLLPCGNQNILRFSATNLGGAAVSTDSRAETIRLIVDTAFQYVSNSFNGIHNIQNEANPEITILDGLQILEWALPTSINVSDSIVFEIKVQSASPEAFQCTQVTEIAFQIVESISLVCAKENTSCPIAFVTNQNKRFLTVQKPNYSVEVLTANSIPQSSNSEWVTLDYNISSDIINNSEDQISVAFYYSPDDSLDISVDTIISTDNQTISLSEINEISSSFELSSDFACGNIFVVIEEGCSCNIAQSILPSIKLKNTSPPDTICFGTATNIGFEPIEGYTYQWLTPDHLDNPTLSNPSYSITDSLRTNFFSETLILKTTRQQGCTTLDTTILSTIKMDAALYVKSNYNEAAISCLGASDGAVEVTHEGGLAPFNYRWTASVIDSNTIYGLSAGKYGVTVTDMVGCEATDSVELLDPDPLITETILSDYNGFNISCFASSDGKITINATGGTGTKTFQWEDGSDNPVLTDLSANTYFVTTTDVNSCAVIDTIFLSQPDSILTTLTVQQPICEGGNNGSITWQIEGGTTPYSFETSNFEDTLTRPNLSAGIYPFNITDANGCLAVLDTVQLEVVVSEFQQTQVDVLCFGEATGAIEVILTEGFAPLTHTWSNGSTSNKIDQLVAGNYQVTVTDANNCNYEFETTITQPPLLTVQLETDSVRCFSELNGAVRSTIGGGTAPYSLSWSNADTTSAITSLSSGTYTVTITDNNQCEVLAAATVYQPTELTLALASDDVRCFGGQDGKITSLTRGGIQPYNYSWSNGATTPTVNSLTAGSYKLLTTDHNGCQVQDSILISQPDSVVFQTHLQEPSCNGFQDGILSFNVLNYDTLLYSLDSLSYQENSVFNDLRADTYTLYIQEGEECTYTFPITLTEPEALAIQLPRNYLINLGDTVQLSPSINLSDDVLYMWEQDTTLSCLDCISPIANPLFTTNYFVSAETIKGCTAENTTQVVVNKQDLIYMPNIFSPNGDRENEYFTLGVNPKAVISMTSFQIFDRWGNLLYTARNLTPELINDKKIGWNGMVNNNPAPSAIYAWVAEVTYIDGRQEQIMGGFSLTR